MTSITILTDKNFADEVEKSQKPVLVDFWSTWCPPCKYQTPIVEDIAEEFSNKIKIAKFDVGENPETPAKLQISGIPTLAIFKNGKITELKTGLQNKISLKNMIHQALTNQQ